MSEENEKNMTPMMRQYYELKKTLPNKTLLLFRLGDFYELFDDDAEIGSRILGITLTHRQSSPMCGIPHHASEVYISKLIQAGYKVALCDQMEDAKPGKLVQRQITRILTPGTVITDNLLQSKHNQYTVCLKWHKNSISMSWVEVSTGDFQITEGKDLNDISHIISALSPQEIILDDVDKDIWENLPTRELEMKRILFSKSLISYIPNFYFDLTRNIQVLKDLLKVENFLGYGIENDCLALITAGALILYVTENLKQPPQNILQLRKFYITNNMIIDAHTFRNLEIVHGAGGTRKNSLLETIDATESSIGARCLEKYLLEPCLMKDEIIRRQNIVKAFYGNIDLLQSISLKKICDIPRIMTRLMNNGRNPREVGGIRSVLQYLPDIFFAIKQFDSEHLNVVLKNLPLLPELRSFLEESLEDMLPNDLSDGGIIRAGFDPDIDKLRYLVNNNHEWISNFELSEQQRTGIKSLRVKYNNNFGYFIEVTKANLRLVPHDYIRKQTMVNGERYITHELKEKEQEILTAREKLIEREQLLFKEIIANVLKYKYELQILTNTLAEIDVFKGWAIIAHQRNYICPTIVDGNITRIKNGRHPVVEKILHESSSPVIVSKSFIPNDTYLNAESEQIALITGPNMAGKSTYIRQVALLQIMAQIGCFVPAQECSLGLVDRIFSRIGANDDLANGTSTFMVEMNETANILNNATNRSLIILDEVGRGTSTYDGLSIAWAVVEFLHQDKKRGPRTLFATHYRELTKLGKTLPRVKNFHVTVKEWNDDIVFLRTITPGCSDKSYGIHVAHLAGMPKSVIDRAKEILEKLEDEGNVLQQILQRRKKSNNNEQQLSLF